MAGARPAARPRPAILRRMDLFLIRHAIAEEPRPGLADADRSLTPDGRGQFERAVAGLARLGLRAERCWHSPWRRAAETAALLAPVLGAPPVVEPLLAEPPGPALLARLGAEPAAAALALVGHQPWLGELAAWLALGAPTHAGGLRVRKGGLLWLRGAPTAGGMEHEAVLKPALLRRIGDLGAG